MEKMIAMAGVLSAAAVFGGIRVDVDPAAREDRAVVIAADALETMTWRISVWRIVFSVIPLDQPFGATTTVGRAVMISAR